MTNNTKVSEADVAIAAVLDEYFPLGTAPQIVLAAASAVRAAMQSERLKGDGEAPLSAVEAFDIGFAWAQMLTGQTLEDSRAVGRTLFCDLFEPIADRIDVSDFNSFQNADAGICAAKAIIRAALSPPSDGVSR